MGAVPPSFRNGRTSVAREATATAAMSSSVQSRARSPRTASTTRAVVRSLKSETVPSPGGILREIVPQHHDEQRSREVGRDHLRPGFSRIHFVADVRQYVSKSLEQRLAGRADHDFVGKRRDQRIVIAGLEQEAGHIAVRCRSGARSLRAGGCRCVIGRYWPPDPPPFGFARRGCLHAAGAECRRLRA